MTLTFRKLHPHFVAEVSPIDLRQVHHAGTLAPNRSGQGGYWHSVFYEHPLTSDDEPFTDDEHLAFAQRLDGQLHSRTGSRVLRKNRLGNEALGDISNLGEDGEILKRDDRRRMYGLGNRLWHTDASFQDPPGRYS